MDYPSTRLSTQSDAGLLISYNDALERLGQTAGRHRRYLETIRCSVQPKPQETNSIDLRRSCPMIPDMKLAEEKDDFESRKRSQVVPFFGTHVQLGRQEQRSLPLRRAVGRQSARTIIANSSTPRHDVSDCDGFAICSSLTQRASTINPIVFRVTDSICAEIPVRRRSHLGVDSTTIYEKDSYVDFDGNPGCVQIIAGARFPVDQNPEMDAVIHVDDVEEISRSRQASGQYSNRYIVITKPVLPKQNRRFAGSDIKKGTMIIHSGEVVQAKHVMALASLRFAEIFVVDHINKIDAPPKKPGTSRRLAVGVLPIGSELVEPQNSASRLRYFGSTTEEEFFPGGRVPNSNGQYITAAIQASGLDIATSSLEITSINREVLRERLETLHRSKNMDVIIATGGFSLRRLLAVRDILENDLGAELVFHGVDVWPGSYILCAILNRKSGEYGSPTNMNSLDDGPGMTVFFGVPGDPLSTTAAFQFFILPYLRMLQQGHALTSASQPVFYEQKLDVRFQDARARGYFDNGGKTDNMRIRTKPTNSTVFWLAKSFKPAWEDDSREKAGENNLLAEILNDQTAYRTSGLLAADCWVLLPAGNSEVHRGDEAIVTRII